MWIVSMVVEVVLSFINRGGSIFPHTAGDGGRG